MSRKCFALMLLCGWSTLSDCVRVSDNTSDAGSAAPTSCGDAVVDINEQCDDGNDDATDSCVNCSVAKCGDGYLSTSEECDPTVEGWRASCSDSCTRTFYGECPSAGCVFDDDGTEVPCGSKGKYCSPICTRDSDCPSMPGYKIECAFAYQCTIRCTSDECPHGMHCIEGDHCGYR